MRGRALTYLVDTNVVAAARRGDAPARDWLLRTDARQIHLSVVTIGEIAKGIALVRRRDPGSAAALESWFADLRRVFAARILPACSDIMLAWGELQALRPRPAMACLIAASARVHGLVVVTRNTADFEDTGVTVLDPWSGAPAA